MPCDGWVGAGHRRPSQTYRRARPGNRPIRGPASQRPGADSAHLDALARCVARPPKLLGGKVRRRATVVATYLEVC